MNNLQYFIRFLKEYSILYAFLDEYIEARFEDKYNTTYQMAIKKLQRETFTCQFIARAFRWDKTKQGYTFWEITYKNFYRWWNEKNVKPLNNNKKKLCQ